MGLAGMTLSSRRILLVDDDEISRLVAAEILTHLGATVDLAAVPDDAMRLVGENRYDLIMLDLFMPNVNGIDLAGIMIALDGSLTEKITLLTAGGPDGSSPVPATRLRVFSKPLQADEVLDFLAAAASEERYDVEAPAENPEYPEIDGIDIPIGIRNFMGLEQSYVATLRAFPEYSRKLLDDLTLNAAKSNTRECRRLAHSLKGSSAMIGALDIHALAKQIESSCTQSPAPGRSADLLQRLEALIHRTNHSIDACITRQHRLFRES